MHTSDCQGCREYLQLSRRQFLAASGGAALAVSLPEWLPRVTLAQDYCSNRDVLVCVFLRGAADGLTLCVPHAEDAYYAARPTLAIARPDSSDPNRATNLDGFFGLPPAMTPLLPAYLAGNLLFVHAVGSHSSSRSHFDAMRFMEVGKPEDPAVFTGWLGRHLASIAPSNPLAILRAVGIGHGLQQSLLSSPKTIPIPDLGGFNLAGSESTREARMNLIGEMYNLVGDPLRSAGQTTQATVELLSAIDFDNYAPGGGAMYQPDAFGYAMKSTAALIKADIGVEAVAVDIPGWDTHNNQGPIQGALAGLMGTLANGLAAFHADIFAGNGRNVTVVVMSEFGRRLDENGSHGCDHGHGGAMLVLGPDITGGRVLTQWPGLAPQNLFEGIDLAVTIDYRDILAELVYRRLGNGNLSFVFPDYVPTFRGVTSPCGQGDLNCDGAVTPADAAAFTQALVNPAGFNAQSCNITGADLNSDGKTNGRDVQAFVQKLLNP